MLAGARACIAAGADGLLVECHPELQLVAAGRVRRWLYATAGQTNLDRNTVDMDRERASFADNAVKYEATLRFINSSVRTQLSAITGQ